MVNKLDQSINEFKEAFEAKYPSISIDVQAQLGSNGKSIVIVIKANEPGVKLKPLTLTEWEKFEGFPLMSNKEEDDFLDKILRQLRK